MTSMTTASAVTHDRYGKTGVRVVRLRRDSERHVVHELTVSIALEGDFTAAYTDGDNTRVLPTDTMKNTVYAFAKDDLLTTIESFARRLAEHFVQRNDPVAAATVTVAAADWRHADDSGQTFVRGSNETATAVVRYDGSGAEVTCGLRGLQILKTSRSGFSDFRHDEYTTLADTDDRLLGTVLDAAWQHDAPDAEHAASRDAIRSALIDAFSGHDSLSVQHTLHAMGEAALAACPTLRRVTLSMPNKHCLLVDLSPFGLDNDNEVFLPVDEPSGLIEGTVERSAGR